MKKLLSLVAASLISTASSAATVLNYTGNPFTNVNAAGYSSNFVSATISLATPLGVNLLNVDVTSLITDWSIGDGVVVVTSATTNPGFVVSTDGTGAIVAWDFTAFDCVRTGIAQIETSYLLPGISPCGTWQNHDLSSVSFTANVAWVLNESPGIWTVTDTEVPEPGSLPLLMTGLLVVLGSASIKRGLKEGRSFAS